MHDTHRSFCFSCWVKQSIRAVFSNIRVVHQIREDRKDKLENISARYTRLKYAPHFYELQLLREVPLAAVDAQGNSRILWTMWSQMRNASGLRGCPQPIRETDAKQLNEHLLVEQTRSGSVLITWKLFRKWLTFRCWQKNKGLHCKRERECVFSSLINSAAKQPRSRASKPKSCHPSWFLHGECHACVLTVVIKINSLQLQAKCVISLGSQIWSKPSEIPLLGVSLHEEKKRRKREKHENIHALLSSIPGLQLWTWIASKTALCPIIPTG